MVIKKSLCWHKKKNHVDQGIQIEKGLDINQHTYDTYFWLKGQKYSV